MADLTGLTRLPELPEEATNEELREYVYQLTTLLRYILSHLDEDNLTDEAAEKLDTRVELERSSALEESVAKATRLITGNRGGYVVLHDGDGDGKPDEILILDQPDKDEAVQVWRWNGAGLGHSSTGYHGPYTTAITQEGEISADFITTGTLRASLLDVIDMTAQSVSSTDSQFLLEVSGARLKLTENGAKRVDLRSNVEQGGYMEVSKGDMETGMYTLAFGDSLVVGGHRDNGANVTGNLYAGTLSATRLYALSLRLRGNDPYLRLYDSAGRERIGLFANAGKLMIFDANGNQTLEIGPTAHFETVTINGQNYQILVKE